MSLYKKIPLSPVAQQRLTETMKWFEDARKKRKEEKGGGENIIAAAPVGDAAASIKKQNEDMGVKDPAAPGFGAQAIPQNPPPIQGAGQAPVGARRKRGATDAPFSKAYVEGQAATQEWFNEANSNRQNRMAREEKERQDREARAEAGRRITSQINR